MIEFFPCTQRFSINSLFPNHTHLVMADLETNPITIIFESSQTAITGKVDTRPATEEETIAIQNLIEQA